MIPSFLSILILFPLPETPKFLLLHRNNREAAISALKYYHGKNLNLEVLLNEMLKESLHTRPDLSRSAAFLEVFRCETLRKACVIGILALQVRCSEGTRTSSKLG